MSEKKMRSEASSSSNNSNSIAGGSDSVVVDVGRRRSSCGYCKSGGPSSISHGLWARSLTVYDYQALLDRGWRRSGCFLYKPEMEKTCCPSYTIRLKANDFVPSKEQRRVLKRMQRWVPFDVAKPLLDRKRYVVLSDFATPNGQPLQPSNLENYEEQNDEQHFHGSNDIFVGEDEEMDEFNHEDSDDELVAESSNIQLPKVEDRDVGHILIGLKEVHLRYRDLRQAFGSSDRQYMETQLHRYMRAVGAELSERMVYSLG